MEPCPNGCWDTVMAEYSRKFLASGRPWYEYFGLRPSGQSRCSPKQRHWDGGDAVVDEKS